MAAGARRSIPRLIAGDFVGLARVCGPGVALSWLGKIGTHFGECRRTGSLLPADRAMGTGPFRARLRGASARLVGESALAGVREIWARDSYLAGGFLTVSPDGVVLDCGANMGVFTLLALGHGPGVRAVCVEAVTESVAKLERSIDENGWRDRVTIVNAFVGGKTRTQEQVITRGQADDVPFVDEDEIIRRGRLERIDLLKCDIEGSEFELFTEDSRLLAMARQVAIEVHKDVGPAEPLLALLRARGFELKLTHDNPHDLVVLGRRAAG